MPAQRELASLGWGIRELRRLPPRVAWFYLRASRRALRADDRAAIRAAAGPESVRHLLRAGEGRKAAVELGTGAGWSTVALALAEPGRSVTSFDPTEWPTRDRYLSLASPQARERIEIKKVEGHLAPGSFAGSADLLFVDSSHDRGETIASVRAWQPRLAPGAVVVFHDYENPDWPGVAEAVRELGLDGEAPGGSLFVWHAS